MAVTPRKSQQITNRDATPSVLNQPALGDSALMKSAFGRVGSVSGDNTGSIYRFCSVPSNARVCSVRVHTNALGGSCAADYGVYRNTRDGGAVVDADFFGSAVSLVSFAQNNDVTFESGVYTLAKREQPLWQALGLSVDPNTTFDIAATLTADSAASADTGCTVDYVA